MRGLGITSCSQFPEAAPNDIVNVGFAFDTARGKGAAVEPAPLTNHVLMTPMDQASLFTGEGMFHRHLCAAAIAVPRHVQRSQIEQKADIVVPFLCREDCATKAMGKGH